MGRIALWNYWQLLVSPFFFFFLLSLESSSHVFMSSAYNKMNPHCLRCRSIIVFPPLGNARHIHLLACLYLLPHQPPYEKCKGVCSKEDVGQGGPQGLLLRLALFA